MALPLAFKDMALQLLPHLITLSAKKNGEEREISILVATSGDTGKAALEGFKDVAGTSCTVFYPLEGVSRVQELQMVTTGGSNTHVIGVRGNFDDAQTGVKRLFASHSFAGADARHGQNAFLRQQHQLRAACAAGGILLQRLCGAAACPQAGRGGAGELRGAHGELWQHTGGVLRPEHGPAGWAS